MELAKKVFRFLSSILFYSIVLILGIAVLMFLASFVDKRISMRNGEYRSPLFGAYIIISESMIPHINVYDAVVTVRVDANSIQVDDIITFISKEIETAGTPITHRVIGIVYEDESKQKIMGFRTKGDNNNTADFALIAPNEVIGKVFLRIPMIGYLQTIMTKPIGWLLIVVLPCLLIIGSDIFKLVKTSKMKDDMPSNENDNTLTNSDSNNISLPISNNLVNEKSSMKNIPDEVVGLPNLIQKSTMEDSSHTMEKVNENSINQFSSIQNLESTNISSQNVNFNNQITSNDYVNNNNDHIDNNQSDIDNVI